GFLFWGPALEGHHRADGLAFVHEVEGLVDPLQRHHVRDEIVDVDLLLHVPVDDFWHVGPAPGAAESGSLPSAAGHQLEGARPDFLARAGHADDHRYTPATVA